MGRAEAEELTRTLEQITEELEDQRDAYVGVTERMNDYRDAVSELQAKIENYVELLEIRSGMTAKVTPVDAAGINGNRVSGIAPVPVAAPCAAVVDPAVSEAD